MKNKYLLLLFLIVNMTIIQSQHIEKYSLGIKSSAFGLLGTETFKGLEANAFTPQYIYTIGYYKGTDEWIFSDQPIDQYNQLNLLFGKYMDSKNQKFRFQYQAGLGYFWGTIKTDEIDLEDSNFLNNAYDTKDVSTVSLPIKIGGRYIPFKFLSIGVDFQANFNFEKIVFSPMLSLEIGKLRNEKKEEDY